MLTQVTKRGTAHRSAPVARTSPADQRGSASDRAPTPTPAAVGEEVSAGTTLLVATPGGHVDELLDLADRFTAPGTRVCWVTARNAQTETLLAGRQVVWVPRVGTRQWYRTLRGLPRALRLLRRIRPIRVVSSGAALTVPYMIAGRALGAQVVYVESATRVDGPSVTGRVAERLPGTTLFRQAGWERKRWSRTTGVFERYAALPREEDSHPEVRSVLVTLGSERFPFQRALQSVATAVPDDVAVRYQTGSTPIPETLPGLARAWWPYGELRSAASDADVIVTHGGVGALLLALRNGQRPVVIPRLSDHGEHVDDHQLELARDLAARGLIVLAEPGDDMWGKLSEAGRAVVRRA